MPCYLFTYHAFGSWLPDRQRGYVKRGRGILQPSEHLHRLYSEAMKEEIVVFHDDQQRRAIDVLLESQSLQRFCLYFASTDLSHIHALVAWHDDRDPVKVRALLKGSLSRSFNAAFHRRSWFVEGASRKRVREQQHFSYLMEQYLPKHDGWKWSRARGWFK